jgi:RNA polymerase sigma-70 factor (ECF subfamily)
MSEPTAPTEDSDPVLVARMARGDRSALSVLYARHAPRLLALTAVILRDRGEAEDVLHDVFLEAWRSAATYAEERGTVAAWLSLRARSRSIDRRRSPARARSVSLEASGQSLGVDPGLEPGRMGDHERLARALSALAVEEQEVILLGYFEGLSSSEIAERIQKPIGTVKSRTRSALHKLRGLLDAGASG